MGKRLLFTKKPLEVVNSGYTPSISASPISRVGETRRAAMTFYDLGYHEERERWITKEWFWYRAHADTDILQQHIDKDEVRETLKRRLESIQLYIERNTQTQRGMIFEILADRTIATLSKLLTLLLSLARGQTLGVW